jgi:nucleoside-diphosphate-sugar epimerase
LRLRGQRVLVIGGTGFVGGRLSEKLILEEGASVRCLVRNWTKAVWLSRTAADLVPGEVTERAAVEAAVAGCDAVFHCASGGSSREEFFATNVDGTRNVLEASLAARVKRVVYVSTIAVHGPSPPDGADETAPFVPTGKAYGESKIATEELIQGFVKQHGMEVSIVRPTFVWGPRSHLFTTGPLRAMKSRTFRLVDEGRGACHAVHVDNLVEAMILCAVTPGLGGEAFLVTDGENMTWREFFEPLARLVNAWPLASVSSQSPATRLMGRAGELASNVVIQLAGEGKSLPTRVLRRLAREAELAVRRRGIPNQWDLAKYARVGSINIDKARRLLGYAPVLSFRDGLGQTLDWVRLQMSDELGL